MPSSAYWRRPGSREEIDASAFLGDEWARAEVSGAEDDDTIAALYVRVADGRVDAVRETVANAANPASDYVSSHPWPTWRTRGRRPTTALSGLALGLTAIALLVGGIGIANTMVVAVLERRGEIGLRRALGARSGQIAAQFVGEAIVLAGIGGRRGCDDRRAQRCSSTRSRISRSRRCPVEVLVSGPLMALAVGVIAGLYPAISASRLSPTTALRTV